MTESVLARVARGDSQAVRECIDEFGGLVWAIARRMTRTRADAEDAVQEIFVDVWPQCVALRCSAGLGEGVHHHHCPAPPDRPHPSWPA